MKLDTLEIGKLNRQIAEAVEKDSVAQYDEGPRSHLGASTMGEACTRKLWYNFRWVKQETFSGRMHRLFKRGHKEEKHFVERLTRIGFQIYEIDPATGKQFRIVGANGHYGGSGDGLGWAPPEYGMQGPGVFEFKTHNEKSFSKLAGKLVSKTPDYVRQNPEGVKKSKPMHFAQMSQYGAAYGCRWGLYMAVNKDTDELWMEFIELDWSLAQSLFLKAEGIVYSQVPPPRISESPAFFDCKYCHLSGICHHGMTVQARNCRSCVRGVPMENAQWGCALREQIIPAEVIPVGCPEWKSVA